MSDTPLVGIIMGSDSDWPTMQAAADVLAELGVAYEADVVSAHRMPQDMGEYARTAANRGLRVIIAGAGGAAVPAASAETVRSARRAPNTIMNSTPKRRPKRVRGPSSSTRRRCRPVSRGSIASPVHIVSRGNRANPASRVTLASRVRTARRASPAGTVNSATPVRHVSIATTDARRSTRTRPLRSGWAITSRPFLPGAKAPSAQRPLWNRGRPLR